MGAGRSQVVTAILGYARGLSVRCTHCRTPHDDARYPQAANSKDTADFDMPIECRFLLHSGLPPDTAAGPNLNGRVTDSGGNVAVFATWGHGRLCLPARTIPPKKREERRPVHTRNEIV